MVYTEKNKIGLKDIGKGNLLKNEAILEILENVGAYHSDFIGYGVNNMNTTGIAWVLLDWKLKVLNRPKYGQVLTVNTWSRDASKFFTYRDYEIYDENNNLCIIATSKWAIMDLRKRKMVKIEEQMINEYAPEEKNVFNQQKLDKLRLPTEFSSEINYIVKRRDLDVNNHMHNLYYLDLAYEALPEDVYNKRPFDNIRITYKKEITCAEKLTCKYTYQNDKHIIVIENDNGEVHSIVEIY